MRVDVKFPSEAGLSPAAVNRSSPMPLYAQIARQLVAEVSRSPADSRFLGDEDVARRFDVSRMTARQAIQHLVDEGFLRRVKGIGTFVVPGKLGERPIASVFDGPVSGDRTMAVRVLAIGGKGPPHVRAEAALGPSPLYIARMRLIGVVPMVIDHRYLPKRLAQGLTRREAETRSLADWLKRSVTLERVDMQVEALGADAEAARHLRVLPGEPTLVRHLRYIAKDGRVVMMGRSIYRGDIVRYGFSVPL